MFYMCLNIKLYMCLFQKNIYQACDACLVPVASLDIMAVYELVYNSNAIKGELNVNVKW